MVGCGGCECDGLVSNTLSLSMSVTSTHPTIVSHSPVCFKAIVFVVTSISVLVLLCFPTFALFVQFPSHWPLSSHCCLHHELCLCVGLVCVCCVMSSDGVWGVDDAVCCCPLPKRQHSTRPCLHVMVCTNVSCCIVCGG